jgi:hypothetical protein
MAENPNVVGYLHNTLETTRRTKQHFHQVNTHITLLKNINLCLDNNVNGPDPTHSIFPADNYELENTRWEEDIIFDAENMSMIPSKHSLYPSQFYIICTLEPRVLTIEYDDEPAIFGVPEDVSYEEKSRDDRNVDRKVTFKHYKYLIIKILFS